MVGANIILFQNVSFAKKLAAISGKTKIRGTRVVIVKISLNAMPWAAGIKGKPVWKVQWIWGDRRPNSFARLKNKDHALDYRRLGANRWSNGLTGHHKSAVGHLQRIFAGLTHER